LEDDFGGSLQLLTINYDIPPDFEFPIIRAVKYLGGNAGFKQVCVIYEDQNGTEFAKIYFTVTTVG
jgi:hypothetical protein